MVDRVQLPEEEANQQLKARNEAEGEDRGVIGAVSEMVDTLVRPLADDRPDDDELARRREENDAAQRPS
jgi:hypothetical protein